MRERAEERKRDQVQGEQPKKMIKIRVAVVRERESKKIVKKTHWNHIKDSSETQPISVNFSLGLPNPDIKLL